MSYKDIAAHLQEMYGLDVSTGTLTAVTYKIIQTVKEWQARPLESIYPIVWLDTIHYKIRENGKVAKKAVYTILGVNLEGRKEVLGLYISENEGANFWLQILTDLSNRGVCDILIACVDGLNDTPDILSSSCIFDGHLSVNNPLKFSKTLINGIGPKKSFGFGMLTIGR